MARVNGLCGEIPVKSGQKGGEIVGHWRLKAHLFARFGVFKAQKASVKGLAAKCVKGL